MRLSMHEWHHVRRSHRAFEAATQHGRREYVGEMPETIEADIVFHADAQRGWFREEREDWVTVRGPQGLVTWTPAHGPVQQDDSQSMETNAHQLLDPIVVAVAHALELGGETTVAGRRARLVRATPRGRARVHLHSLPLGADEVDLAVDLERGILLRTEARFEGEPFHVREVTAIELDGELPPETFVFELPPGERLRTPQEAFAIEHLSVEEAAARASFTVWVPSGLDARWDVTAIHQAANERAGTRETLHLIFHDDALHSFQIEEAGEPLLAWRGDEPDVVVRDGVELRVFEGERPGLPPEVRLERGGTHIRVSSDSLDRERLLKVAASLVEAPTELPPV